MMFPDFTSKVEDELAILMGSVSHHLHPDIVKYISTSNLKFKEEFQEYSPKGLDIQEFLFENSDCVFPGSRRNINKESKKAKWKNNVYEDGTILNDNTFPRHLWSFLVCGKSYSSRSWTDTGLNAFELAHVFGHKVDETSLEKRCFKRFEEDIKPYALFTSASNVVLIPSGLTKPTDKLESIKLCYYQRHIDLYGENFFHMSGFRKELVPDWYKDIKWLEPVMPQDWKKNVDLLLEYRANYLRTKYGGKPVSGIQTDNSMEEIKEKTIVQIGDLKHASTRFFVDEKIYRKLLGNPRSNFILTVTPNKGKHPKGIYSIPNQVIVKYIEMKRADYNWQKNKTYHQDGIPKDLKAYFKFR